MLILGQTLLFDKKMYLCWIHHQILYSLIMKEEMKRTLTTVLCLLVGFSFTMAQVKLAFNPDKGVKYRYCVGMLQDIKQKVMEQSIPMTQKLTTGYDMEVIAKNKEEMTVSFLFVDIYYEISSSMLNIKYDSRNPSSDATGMNAIFTKLFGSMLGKKLNAVILPDGSVKSVTGMEAIVEEMMKRLEADGAMGTQIGQNMQQQFNDEAMCKSFEQSLKVYPSKSLKIGDSYEVIQENNLAGLGVGVKSIYQLDSVDKETAYMTVKSEISGMEGKLTGNQVGSVQFDLKTGILKLSDMEQKFTGTLATQGVEVALAADSKTKVTIDIVK